MCLADFLAEIGCKITAFRAHGQTKTLKERKNRLFGVFLRKSLELLFLVRKLAPAHGYTDPSAWARYI